MCLSPQRKIRLSVCITTLNRGRYIGSTLVSILQQATDECEVLVLDAGSTDDTSEVVQELAVQFKCLRYIRQPGNNGIDRDYDRAVEFSRGAYCWLMSDDDLLKPGALSTVLSALQYNASLVIVNAEVRYTDLSQVLQDRWMDIECDRIYSPSEMDSLLIEVRYIARFIGCVVIARSLWLSRERQRYFGSLFIHVGVIFQSPLPSDAVVIAKPLIIYRWGNAHTFSSKELEIELLLWPALIWSLCFPASVKTKVYSEKPWRVCRDMLFWRAMGIYSYAEYNRLISPRLRTLRERVVPCAIAVLPGALVNTLLFYYYRITGSRYRGVWQPRIMLEHLKASPFHRPFRSQRVLTAP